MVQGSTRLRRRLCRLVTVSLRTVATVYTTAARLQLKALKKIGKDQPHQPTAKVRNSFYSLDCLTIGIPDRFLLQMQCLICQTPQTQGGTIVDVVVKEDCMYLLFHAA